MGTRADFYVGRGKDAEWLGSIAWDGHPDSIPDRGFTQETCQIFTATAEKVYRDRVSEFLKLRRDATLPEEGWPWPWEDGTLTDYSYAFDDGVVYFTPFGHGWHVATEEEPEDTGDIPKVDFPDMTERQNVTFGDRSGLIIVSG